MFNTLSSAGTSIGAFFQNSLLAKIILAILVLLLILVILIPLIGKLRRKKIKTKETREIIKDLMVWRHLSQLVKGGDEHNKAKEILSDSILKINELLKQGFALVSSVGYGLYGLPWYVLLGEPRSGKSSLLKESELELIPSAAEKSEASFDDPKNSLPVRMWVGTKAVVCDISGKVFFDRWLEGSSAEWNYIIKQLCRKRRRKPLEGIILTIPADALMADNDTLSNKKAILMANELRYLLQTSGMRLPCYVVITKIDMVYGFREYVMGIAGNLRHQILGFENDSPGYNPETFKRFWDGLLVRLRSGYKRSMLSREVATRLTAMANRMDITGKIYTFPENFASLYANLDIYLSILFGEDNFQGSKEAIFEGLSFTTSTDTGVSFSPDIAALGGRKADELPITQEEPAEPQPYFIRDMLHKWIFNPSPHAVFTRNALIQRHVPYYLFSGLMILMGIGWLLAACFKAESLRVSLIQPTTYYDALDALLRRGTPFESLLIDKQDDNAYRVDQRSLGDGTISSRIQFYFNALAYRDMPLKPPFGFLLSDLLVFNFEPNMGYRDRVFIADQLYGAMLRTPVIKDLGAKLIQEENQPVTLDQNLRAAIHSFTLLDELTNEDLYKLFSSNQFNIAPMISYLVPDLPKDSVEFLNSYVPKYDRKYAFTIDVAYIYSDDFAKADRAAINLIISAWRRSAAYPDSLYGRIKNLILISDEILLNYDKITDALQRINQVSALEEVQALVDQWNTLTKRQASLINQGRTIFADLRDVLIHLPLGFDPATGLDVFGNTTIYDILFNDLIIAYAVKDYTALFNEDMNFVKKKIQQRPGGNLGEAIPLMNGFSRDLTREVEHLKQIVGSLKAHPLLTEKISDDKNADSLFAVVEKLLALSAGMEMPIPEQLNASDFRTNWQKSKSQILKMLDTYTAYTKPYQENQKVSDMIAHARNMLLAQAYLNRYRVFESSLSFLTGTEVYIAAHVGTQSADNRLFSFSENAIQSSIGGLSYNQDYDPRIVQGMIQELSSFITFFTQQIDPKELPLFLQNEKSSYETEAFKQYLDTYMTYWGTYPDNAYMPSATWSAFKKKLPEYKSYLINSVLEALYLKSIAVLNDLDNNLLSETLLNKKKTYMDSLQDQIGLLHSFLSGDADLMLTAWDQLPSNPEEAFHTLQAASDQELKASYLTVYSGKKDLRIGWWDDLILNGINLLSQYFNQGLLKTFAGKLPDLKAFPLCADSPVEDALSFKDLEDIASLFSAMGATLPPEQTQQEESPQPQAAPARGTGSVLYTLIHPSLFKGYVAQGWAQDILQFSVAATDPRKPLVWTLSQPAIDVQMSLPMGDKLLAANRFRYIQVSVGEKMPQRFSTYMNRPITLAQGNALDRGLSIKFFKLSEDKEPAVYLTFNNRWSIFNLYLRKDRVSDDGGKSYIPLSFVYEGRPYLYFVEIGFNRSIPKPETWYTRGTWPPIKITNALVSGNP